MSDFRYCHYVIAMAIVLAGEVYLWFHGLPACVDNFVDGLLVVFH